MQSGDVPQLDQGVFARRDDPIRAEWIELVVCQATTVLKIQVHTNGGNIHEDSLHSSLAAG